MASPLWLNFIAIGVGAAGGAWLRWGLGILLNPMLETLPLGTWVANLLGGFLMGCALLLFEFLPEIPPAAKLLVTTGFLGGLTTFSTFSAEGLSFIQREAWIWLVVHMLLHVLGALLAAWSGYELMIRLRGMG